MAYTEKKFETHIESSMLLAGWKNQRDSAYDKQRCVLSEVLLKFLTDSQELTMNKLYMQYAEQTAEKLVQRIDA
jgi:hypothetical protein